MERGATSGSFSLATATLAPATGVTASATCPSNKSGDVLVRWTASASSFVTGYTVTRAVNGGAPTTLATLPATASSYDDLAVTGSTTYVYAVTATYRSWTSSSAAAPAVSTPKHC